MMAKKHDDFKLSTSDTGLFIDHTNPILIASPDGVMEYSCCNKSVAKIKSPYCYNQDLLDDNDNTFCMINRKGNWSLKREHMHYYQVKLQLHVCVVNYADFVVWNKSTVAIERIDKEMNL